MIYVGPVAACMCMAHQMPMVASCPDSDDADHQHDSEHPASSTEAPDLCNPSGAEALPESSFELTDPVFVVVETVRLDVATGLGQSPLTPRLRPLAQGPPVYFATRRFRL